MSIKLKPEKISRKINFHKFSGEGVRNQENFPKENFVSKNSKEFFGYQELGEGANPPPAVRLRFGKEIRNNKSQVFSSEVLVAYFIFSLTVILILFLWNVATTEIRNSERLYALEEKANDLGEKLIKTRGIPENWTKDDVLAIGLSTEEARILDPRKVKEFVELMNESYEEKSHLLGLGKYEFFFNLTDIDGNQIKIENVSCFTGRIPEDEIEKLTVRRTGLLNGSIVRITLTVWLGEVTVSG